VLEFDADKLQTDPAVIATGTASEPEAKDGSPACQAAVESFRTALMFRVVFTLLVVATTLAATVATVIFVWRAVEGFDVTAALTAASAVATSGLAALVAKRMVQAIKVQKQALADVGKYCGTEKRDQLK
jgi:hypothetical protein